MLVGGTAGAQTLLLLAAPILTRLYSPEDFGLLAVYMALMSAVGVIACLRYELAIPLPKSDTEAASVVVLALMVLAVVTLLTAGVLWVGGGGIASALGVPRLAEILWLLPIGVSLYGIYSVFSHWALRTQSFTSIARTRVSQTVSILAVQLLGFKAGGIALVIGQAGGQGIGGLLLIRTAFCNSAFRQWQWSDVWQAKKRFREFPLLSTWSSFLNVVGGQLPPLLFAMLFNASAAGLYALAHRVLAMPMTVVGEAIGKVFFSNAAEAYRAGTLAALVKKVHDKLALIAMPPAVALMIIGPELFVWIFGDSWRMAGEFARWMAPWLYIVFITSPLSTLSLVMGKQREELLFQIILMLVRSLAIFLGAWSESLKLAVVLFSGVSAVCWVGYMLWVIKLTNNNISDFFKSTLQLLIVSITVVSPLFGILNWPVYSFVWWASLITCMGLVLLHYWHHFSKAY